MVLGPARRGAWACSPVVSGDSHVGVACVSGGCKGWRGKGRREAFRWLVM